MSRVILIVLDSVGIGAARDASRFHDEAANTLGHIGEWCKKNQKPFTLPNLAKWGLGNLVPTSGIEKVSTPKAGFGSMTELSPGKDITTGHWELAGNVLREEFPVYEHGFTDELLNAWCKENNLPGWLCNKPASGTTVIDEFGEEHLRTGKPIVYTSGDSVFQIAWSEEAFGIEKLYAISQSARRFVDAIGIGRVIARPFVGKKKGEFKRTENRKDYSVPPPSPNLLDVLCEKKLFVAGVGKIEDIFAHRSVPMVDHTGRNETSLESTLKMMQSTQGKSGLIFTNLIDFDMLHGHRRNPSTYADALMAFDLFLPKIEAACSPDDLLVLTADHGNDPTHTGTDHTRENVPLLVWSPRAGFKPGDLGECTSFATVARLTLEFLKLGQEVERLDGARISPSLVNKLGLA